MNPAISAISKAVPVRLSHRSFISLASAARIALSLLLFGQSAWILAKAQLAQALLERTFNQSVATGVPVKAWS
jgi:sortase A